MTHTTRIDATGLLCPLPVLKLAKQIKKAQPGDVVELCADDPAAVVDVPHYCAEAGHKLIGTEEDGDQVIYRVEKR